jgi:Fe-S cluster biogenesis protein NfuA
LNCDLKLHDTTKEPSLSQTLTESDKALRERIEEALDRIRPAIEADGGDVELVDVAAGVASVRMNGACRGCPMAQMTLNMGIEFTIRQSVPEVLRVVAVEDDDDY